MRKATLYAFSLPMEAGVILRYQRLKTRDGLLVRLQEGDNEGWGKYHRSPNLAKKRWRRQQKKPNIGLPSG